MAIITGKVVDENGKPVGRARVMFTRSPVAVPDIAALTAEDGTFTLSAPANGEYEISTYTDDQQGTAAIDVDSDHHDIEVRLGK